jgi:hypothetical protein
MNEKSFVLETESHDRGMAWKALSALAFGALLGVLVSVPYDQLFGFYAPLRAALQSLVATASITCLAVNGTRLTLETLRLPQPALEQRTGEWTMEIERFRGNLNSACGVF